MACRRAMDYYRGKKDITAAGTWVAKLYSLPCVQPQYSFYVYEAGSSEALFYVKDNTKAEVGALVGRRELDAMRRSAAFWRIEPATAAKNTALTGRWTRWINVCRISIILSIVPIAAPFPDVSVHIV